MSMFKRTIIVKLIIYIAFFNIPETIIKLREYYMLQYTRKWKIMGFQGGKNHIDQRNLNAED